MGNRGNGESAPQAKNFGEWGTEKPENRGESGNGEQGIGEWGTEKPGNGESANGERGIENGESGNGESAPQAKFYRGIGDPANRVGSGRLFEVCSLPLSWLPHAQDTRS